MHSSIQENQKRYQVREPEDLSLHFRCRGEVVPILLALDHGVLESIPRFLEALSANSLFRFSTFPFPSRFTGGGSEKFSFLGLDNFLHDKA